MSSPNLHRTRNSLPEAIRTQAVDLLNRHLACAVDLKAQAKQAHWNVKGSDFIALHELFDKVADEAEGFVDLIAERITALGGVAEGTVQIAAQRTTLPAYPTNIFSAPDHLDSLSNALALFGKSVREAIDAAAAFGDADTADLFTEISRETDKQLWFVEAHLHG
jgi:starvation-inducible DNA-binding protein